MNHAETVVLLDDVLFAFRRENAAPTSIAVETWIARYPQFADEICEEAVLWAEAEFNNHLHRPDEADERLVREAQSLALNALYKARQAKPFRTSQPRNVVDAIKAAGMTLEEASRQMGLPHAILAEVSRGRVISFSIPPLFTRMLARLLGRDETSVSHLYPNAVAMAHSIQLNGEGEKVGQLLTFQDAVRNSDSLSDAQKEFWMEEL